MRFIYLNSDIVVIVSWLYFWYKIMASVDVWRHLFIASEILLLCDLEIYVGDFISHFLTSSC